MTWAHVLSSGSGKVAYRVEIEGFPYCFVTDPELERSAIAGDTDGQAWYRGLLRDGLQIDDQADIPRAKLKGGGMVIRIVDYDLRATEAFTRVPSRTMYLTAAISSGDTSMSVNSTTGFSAGEVVHLGTEAIYLDNASNPATITRGFYGSIPQGFSVEYGSSLRTPAITDFPVSLEGRRVRLYAYGEGDDFTGPGTIVYRGVASGEASLSDLTTYEFGVDSLARLFDQTIGNTDTEIRKPRGIYHPWNSPLIIDYRRFDTSAARGGAVDDHVSKRFVGFWEDNEELVAAINDWASTSISSWYTQIYAVAEGDSKIGFIARCSASGAPYVEVEIRSLIETSDGLNGWYLESGTSGTTFVDNMSVSTSYKFRASVSAPVPRGTMGPTAWDGEEDLRDLAEQTSYPDKRIYLSGFAAVDAAEIILTSGDGEFTSSHTVDSADTSNRSVVLSHDMAFPAGIWTWGDLQPPEIRVCSYLTADDGVGNIVDVMDYILSNSPDLTNLGVLPFITSDDFDATYARVRFATASRGIAFLNSRKYVITKGFNFSDFLAEECKLAGLYLSTEYDGKITFESIDHAVSTAVSTISITHSTTVYNTLPTYERSPWGSVNTVKIECGYNAINDDHGGPVYVVRDVNAFSYSKTTRVLEISPKSEYITAVSYAPEISEDEAVRISSRVMSIFGRPYATITLGVPITYYSSSQLGAYVSLTNNHLPDSSDGTRGWSTAKPGVLVGKRWDLSTGAGWLTVLVALTNNAGYTPCVAVTSPTGGGPFTTTTLTVAANPISGSFVTKPWLPGATDPTDFFTVGDRIILERWDSYTAGIIRGAVTSVTSTTLGVSLDSAWTPSSAYTYVVRFDQSDKANTTTSQYTFAYTGRSDMLLHRTSDTVQARVYL